MSRLSLASNTLMVRALRAMLVRLVMVVSLGTTLLGCAEDAPVSSAADAGAQSSAQPVAAPAMPAATAMSSAGATAQRPPPPPVSCGDALCMRPKNIAADLLMSVTGLPMTGADTVACCLDEAEGICSAAASVGASCDTVATMDNRCPGVDLSALADLVGGLVDMTRDAMIGCCTHGACGLDGRIFGRGCVENEEAKRMLSVVPVIGPLIDVPPPRACDLGEIGEVDNDAGI